MMILGNFYSFRFFLGQRLSFVWVFGVRFGVLGRMGSSWADFWILWGSPADIWDNVGLVLVAFCSGHGWLVGVPCGEGWAWPFLFNGVSLGSGLGVLLLLLLL